MLITTHSNIISTGLFSLLPQGQAQFPTKQYTFSLPLSPNIWLLVYSFFFLISSCPLCLFFFFFLPTMPQILRKGKRFFSPKWRLWAGMSAGHMTLAGAPGLTWVREGWTRMSTDSAPLGVQLELSNLGQNFFFPACVIFLEIQMVVYNS